MAELSMASAGGGTVSSSQKYGAIELKEIYQRNYWRGLAIACAILIVGFGGPWLYDKFFADDDYLSQELQSGLKELKRKTLAIWQDTSLKNDTRITFK